MEGREALARDPTRLEHPPDTGARPGTHPPRTATLDVRPPDCEASLPAVLSRRRGAFVRAAPGHSTEHGSLVGGKGERDHNPGSAGRWGRWPDHAGHAFERLERRATCTH